MVDQELFKLDKSLRPTAVSGVPPINSAPLVSSGTIRSMTGQYSKEAVFHGIVDMRTTLERFDIVRLNTFAPCPVLGVRPERRRP
jgi:hypothetical protein